MMKLHKSKEQSDRLDAENRALKEKVHTLEEEKKTLLDQVNRLLFAEFVYLKKKKTTKNKKRHVTPSCCLVFVQLAINDADQDVAAKDERKNKNVGSEAQNHLSAQEKDHIHKR